MNNSCLGMVREFQEIYFDEHYQSTVKDYSCVSFEKIARAYDIRYVRITDMADFKKSIHSILNYKKPVIVDVILPKNTHVYPKLLVNQPVENQYPYIDENELKSQMIIKPFLKIKK